MSISVMSLGKSRWLLVVNRSAPTATAGLLPSVKLRAADRAVHQVAGPLEPGLQGEAKVGQVPVTADLAHDPCASHRCSTLACRDRGYYLAVQKVFGCATPTTWCMPGTP